MNNDFAVGSAHICVFKSMCINKLFVIVNLAIANEFTVQQVEGLIASGRQPVDSKAVKSDSAVTLHTETAVVWTTMRYFSKIVL